MRSPIGRRPGSLRLSSAVPLAKNSSTSANAIVACRRFEYAATEYSAKRTAANGVTHSPAGSATPMIDTPASTSTSTTSVAILAATARHRDRVR